MGSFLQELFILLGEKLWHCADLKWSKTGVQVFEEMGSLGCLKIVMNAQSLREPGDIATEASLFTWIDRWGS